MKVYMQLECVCVMVEMQHNSGLQYIFQMHKINNDVYALEKKKEFYDYLRI